MLLQAEGGLHGWVCGAGRPDAELGDGGLDGADRHVTTEDDILLGLLSRVRLQREKREMFRKKDAHKENEAFLPAAAVAAENKISTSSDQNSKNSFGTIRCAKRKKMQH